MAISTARYTLGTAAVMVCAPDNEALVVVIHNDDKTSGHSTFIGNQSVSTANGFVLHESQYIELTLPAGSPLFAISDPAGVIVSVIRMASE